VLFSGLLAVQRAFAIESDDAARDGLRLSGLDPAGIFLGKAGAVAAQLVALEVLLAAGLRVRETLLPLLLLPVLAPVLLGATRASEAALGQGLDSGWRWVQLLTTFAVVYVTFGVLAFGPLLEEST
jgi:heme exporter protein B